MRKLYFEINNSYAFKLVISSWTVMLKINKQTEFLYTTGREDVRL